MMGQETVFALLRETTPVPAKVVDEEIFIFEWSRSWQNIKTLDARPIEIEEWQSLLKKSLQGFREVYNNFEGREMAILIGWEEEVSKFPQKPDPGALKKRVFFNEKDRLIRIYDLGEIECLTGYLIEASY